MTVRLSRRDALLFTGAVAAANALSRVSTPAVAAPLGTNGIDAILKARVDAGDAPGVVAMAATKEARQTTGPAARGLQFRIITA